MKNRIVVEMLKSGKHSNAQIIDFAMLAHTCPAGDKPAR